MAKLALIQYETVAIQRHSLPCRAAAAAEHQFFLASREWRSVTRRLAAQDVCRSLETELLRLLLGEGGGIVAGGGNVAAAAEEEEEEASGCRSGASCGSSGSCICVCLSWRRCSLLRWLPPSLRLELSLRETTASMGDGVGGPATSISMKRRVVGASQM